MDYAASEYAASEQEQPAADTKLRLFIAGCLSSAIPGAGHLFRKQRNRALVWLAAFILALILSVLLKPWRGSEGLMAAILAGTALISAAGIDAAFSQTDEAMRVTKWATLLFACIAFVASASANQLVWQVSGYKTFSIPSEGMQPTIIKGESIVANMHAYRGAPPERGDVVIYDNPQDKHQPLLKRVIAIPGDTIQGEHGKITLNGVPIVESYVANNGVPPEYVSAGPDYIARKTYDFGPVKLGPREYFVMGDNRPYSFDSRHTGPVKLETIRGKALYILNKRDDTRDGKRLD
jgi:signal peptidase I